MRRMYSEQELTNVIKAVFDQELEDGALDDKVADAVDDYLTEHPVDPTAITGLDIAPKDVTASGNITAPSIIEDMSGYSFTKGSSENYTYDYIYAGVVKNGNKITFVVALNLTKNAGAGSQAIIGSFAIPSAVSSKIYPTLIGGTYQFVDDRIINCFSDFAAQVSATAFMQKYTNTLMCSLIPSNLVQGTKYFVRYEVTILLSDTLVPEE